MVSVLDEQRQYLSDVARLTAFRRALHAVIRPGDVVIDLGCGTGILGLLACRAGARRVYAIDGSSAIELARSAAQASPFADRIVHIAAQSTQVVLPRRADVLIGDQIGRMGFDAGVSRDYADARRRLLKRGARIVPLNVTTHVAPVEAPELFARIEFWRSPHAGFSFAAAREIAMNTAHAHHFHPDNLLAPGRRIVRCDLTGSATARGLEAGRVAVTIQRAGVLHGLAGWFSAELAPGVTMTNGPGARGRIDRRQAYLPIDRATRVRAGDRVTMSLMARPVELIFRWRVAIERKGRVLAQFDHCTLREVLLANLPQNHKTVISY